MILHYIKIAIRNIFRYKLQNTISIAGLSVSLLCFSLCLYCSRFLQSIDSCFTNHKRIAEVQFYVDNRLFSGTVAPFAEVLKSKQYPEIEAICRAVFPDERPYNVYLDKEKSLPYTFQTMEVDTSYAVIFTPHVLYGSWQQAASSVNSLVITETMARRVFDNPANAIGKQLELSRKLFSSPESTPKTGGIYYTIRAVIKDLPTNTSMHLMKEIDLLVLNDSEGLFLFEGNNSMTGCYTYALLKKGIRPHELNRHLIESELTYPLYDETAEIRSVQIGDSRSIRQVTDAMSLIIAIVGTLILLTGLLNFFYFLIGQFMSRTHEYSIRKVNGCNSFQLFIQLFIQSALLVLLTALFAGCLLEQIASGLRIDLFQFHLAFDTKLLWLHTGEYLLLILLVCMIICLLAVLRIRKITIQTGIRGGKSRYGKHTVRNLMLGVQFFICWLFVSLTFALYRQTDTSTKALFNTLSLQEKESILSFTLNYPFMKMEEKQDLVNRIRQQAGVKDLLVSVESYTGANTRTGFQLNEPFGKKIDTSKMIDTSIKWIPNNFFSFMQIPLQSGHPINQPGEMLVDDVFIQKHKEVNIGNTLYNYNDAYQLCGISTSFYYDIYDQNMGTVFLPLPEGIIGHCYVKAYPGQEKQMRKFIQDLLRETLPSSIQPVVQTFKEDIQEKQALETKMKDIVFFFTAVCLIITLLGVYSAITLDTEHRQKEVAIRKVNGATSGAIIRLFARFYIKLLLFSAVLALPLVLLILNIWKRMYIVFFEQDILYWGGIALAILSLTTGTILSRIKKAADRNPAEAIKSE